MEVLGDPSLDYVRVFSCSSWFSECSCETAAMFVGTLVFPIGLLITGWTVQAHTHWIAPDIVSAHSPEMIDSTHVWREMQIGHRARWCGRHS